MIRHRARTTYMVMYSAMYTTMYMRMCARAHADMCADEFRTENRDMVNARNRLDGIGPVFSLSAT